MKRAICWVLVAAIMLGFLGMIAFSVFAESYVSTVYITTPTFLPGDDITTDVNVEIEGGTLVRVMGWLNEDWSEASGLFVLGNIYILQLELQAPEGQAYSAMNTSVCANDWEHATSISVDAQDETRMVVSISIPFQVPAVREGHLEGISEDVEAGPAVVTGMYATGDFVLTGARWTDLDKNTVATLEDGKGYYLEVTLAPVGGYAFRDWFNAYIGDWCTNDYEIISTTEAKAWFHYSLLPGLGDVFLTPVGFEVGKPIAEATVSLPEDSPLTLDKVTIMDQGGNVLTEGVFEENKNYRVEYQFLAKEGYHPNDIDSVSIKGISGWGWGYWEGILEVNYTYTTCQPVGTVVLNSSGIAVGKPISDVKLEILEGSKVTLDRITVADPDTYEIITGNFESGRRYRVTYELLVNEGYSANDGVSVIFNGGICDEYGYGTTTINVTEYVNTGEEIKEIALTVREPEVGASAADCTVTTAEDTYTVEYKWFESESNAEVIDTFLSDRMYRLEINLKANVGYQFSEDVAVTVNGTADHNYSIWIPDWNDRAVIREQFDFCDEQLASCNMMGAPYAIQPGVAEIPELTATSIGFSVAGVRWVDADKKPVTVFEEGKLYYLEVTLATVEGYQFQGEVDVWVADAGWADETAIIDEHAVKAWLKYSLEPGFSEVELTVTGIGLGMPVDGVTVTLPEDANYTLSSFSIYDTITEENVKEGNFQDGHRYRINYWVYPKDGYRLDELELAIVNGQEEIWWIYGDDVLLIETVFSTCEPVGTVELTSSGLEEGAAIADVKLEVPEDAKVTLESIVIYDVNNESVTHSTFQNNSGYTIVYTLKVKDGYSPEDGMELILNGNSHDIYDFEAQYISVYEYFSTCEVIDEVRITFVEPQVGGSVDDAAATLETENCIMEYHWEDDDTGEEVTGTFLNGHSYILAVDIYPKEGYVLSQDVELLLNGEQPAWGYVSYDGYNAFCYVHRSPGNNNNLTQIDLGFTEPVVGASFDDCVFTAPEDAGYTVSTVWYDQDPSGNSEVFQKGHSYRLILGVFPKEGYSIDENAVILVNGQQDPELYYYLELDSGSLSGSKEYAFGVSLETIELTMPEPEAGALISETVLTAPEGAQYEVFTMWYEEDSEEVLEDGTFEAGKHYRLHAELAMPGFYGFKDVAEITVNGEPVNWSSFDDLYNTVWLEATYYVSSTDAPVEPDTPDVPAAIGDLDGVAGVNEDDAIYLLQYVLLPDLFPVEGNVDFDKNGSVDEDDAIYLLQHVLLPDLFPLA